MPNKCKVNLCCLFSWCIILFMIGRPPTPPVERFWPKVNKSDDCWVWLGGKDSHGYGVFSIRLNGKSHSVGAHKFSYELLVNKVPKGMELDHLCRNRGCVNPAHMEVVTARTNTLRGNGITAYWSRQTHCLHGHKYTTENTYITTKKPNARFCRTCRREWNRDHR